MPIVVVETVPQAGEVEEKNPQEKGDGKEE